VKRGYVSQFLYNKSTTDCKYAYQGPRGSDSSVFKRLELFT